MTHPQLLPGYKQQLDLLRGFPGCFPTEGEFFILAQWCPTVTSHCPSLPCSLLLLEASDVFQWFNSHYSVEPCGVHIHCLLPTGFFSTSVFCGFVKVLQQLFIVKADNNSKLWTVCLWWTRKCHGRQSAYSKLRLPFVFMFCQVMFWVNSQNASHSWRKHFKKSEEDNSAVLFWVSIEICMAELT